MEIMETLTRKKELIDWLQTVEDREVLLKIHAIKAHTEFEFDKAFDEGLTTEEFRAEMKKRIRAFDKET